MTENIAGKTVVITGASSGMGAAAARHLAAKGAAVVLGARRSDRIDALVAEIIGRVTASQIASASAMSFFWRFTYGFT